MVGNKKEYTLVNKIKRLQIEENLKQLSLTSRDKITSSRKTIRTVKPKSQRKTARKRRKKDDLAELSNYINSLVENSKEGRYLSEQD